MILNKKKIAFLQKKIRKTSEEENESFQEYLVSSSHYNERSGVWHNFALQVRRPFFRP